MHVHPQGEGQPQFELSTPEAHDLTKVKSMTTITLRTPKGNQT